MSQTQEAPSPHLLQRLGSRVAHLVDKKVLPLLEGLPTFVTDVIAYLCKTRGGVSTSYQYQSAPGEVTTRCHCFIQHKGVYPSRSLGEPNII